MGITNEDSLTLGGNLSVAGTAAVTGTSTFTGAITATGGMVGNVTGNTSGTAGSTTGNAATVSAPTPQVISAASGAITLPTSAFALAVITYNSGAGGYTLADPATPANDGQVLEVLSNTVQAHVITAGTSGFNNKGSSGTATYSAILGNGITARFVAYNGKWWSSPKTGIVVA